MKFYFLIVIFLITVPSVKSQVTKIDSIYGSIKRIREKVINLDNLDEGTTEYSDSIILLPNSLNLNIYDSSFSGSASEYVNFERFYNENGSILKHIWLIKNDEFYKSITYNAYICLFKYFNVSCKLINYIFSFKSNYSFLF